MTLTLPSDYEALGKGKRHLDHLINSMLTHQVLKFKTSSTAYMSLLEGDPIGDPALAQVRS